jgi:hypothetical protein
MKNKTIRNREINRILGLNRQIDTVLFDVAKGLRDRTLDWNEAKDMLAQLSLLDLPYPVLRGFLFTNPDFNSYAISVYCPYCKSWHMHGLAEDELDLTKKFPQLTGNSHRVAHCTSKTSPFKKTGYYLELFTEEDFKSFKTDIRYCA